MHRAQPKLILLRLAAFLIPAGILLLALVRLGVYPFGDKSMLTVDMNSEYIDYFMQLSKIFREQGSFLRSQDMGMGLNMVGLIAFYTASPLNLLLILSPAAHLTEAVLVLTVLKFGLCGLFFSVYCSHTFDRSDLINLACSVAYALMSYNLAYSSNIMWLDGVYLLPLVLMGVEKLLTRDKYLQYILSLVLVFWCSYYIGYMIGVFTFFYFTFRFFTQPATLRDYGKKLLRFVGGAALAAGCCAVLLLPAFLNLCAGQDKLWGIAPSALTDFYPITKLATKLVPGVYDSLTDSGLPHIFVTTAVVLLAVLFFLNRTVPLREKMVFALFTGVMVLSLSWEFADLAWHVFEDPTWFPARYSFVFSFLLLHLALRGLAHFDGITIPRTLTAMGLCLLMLFEISVSGFRFILPENILLGMFLVFCYGGILLALLMKPGARGKGALFALGFLLLCSECYYNAGAQLAGIDDQFGYRTRAGYYSYRNRYLPAVELAEREYPGVHRIEVGELRNANGGMALGYNGISHYSTTTDQTLNTLLRKLGYNTGTINEVRFAPTTPVTNGLMGIRYLLTTDGPGPGYVYASKSGKVGIYENLAAFPIAFFGEAQALSVDTEERDPFLLQNAWVTALLGNEELAPFRPLEVVEESPQNLVPSDRFENAFTYYRPLSDIDGALDFTLYNPEFLQAYAFFPVYERRFTRAEAYSEGVSLGQELSYRNNTVLSLGEGEYPQVRLVVDSNNVYIDQKLFYGLDMDNAMEAATLAGQREMEFTRFEDTAIDGTVTAPRAGILATSLPYDEGWTVKVDGKKEKLHRLMGVFLAVELPEGEHTVTMRYSPPGFRAGMVISLLCLAGLLLWTFRARLPQKWKKALPAPKDLV